jgi:hypothetical protein
MSWLKLDDGVLDHPKFVRAERLAGSSAFHLWVGLISYCKKYLTDGVVPLDMLPKVNGPRQRWRGKALEALLAVGLIERAGDSLVVHDYLDWNDSRETIEQKAKARGVRRPQAGCARSASAHGKVNTDLVQSERRSRVVGSDGGASSDSGKVECLAPVCEASETETEAETETETVENGGSASREPVATSGGPKPNADIEGMGPRKQKPRRPALWHFAPEAWQPNDEHRARAKARGLDDAKLALEVERFRNYEFKSPKSDPDRAFHNWLTNARDGQPAVGAPPRQFGRAYPADLLAAQAERVHMLRAQEAHEEAEAREEVS